MSVSQSALKKVRKQARIRSRESGLTYAQALEDEARSLGFRTYRTLLDDSENPSYPLFERFRPVLEHGSISPSFDELLIDYSDALRAFYAPFDYVNARAKVVLVGITPGKYQAEVAIKSAQTSLSNNMGTAALLQLAKTTASFSGSMRKNLCAVLDHAGLQRHLNITSTADLFGEHADLVHNTSVLRYPIIKNGENYSGTPDPLKNRFLKHFIMNYFVPETRQLHDAIFIPLGRAPSNVLHYLVCEGILAPDRVIFGIPHPSGANNGRIQTFLKDSRNKNIFDADSRAKVSSGARPNEVAKASPSLKDPAAAKVEFAMSAMGKSERFLPYQDRDGNYVLYSRKKSTQNNSPIHHMVNKERTRSFSQAVQMIRAQTHHMRLRGESSGQRNVFAPESIEITEKEKGK